MNKIRAFVTVSVLVGLISQIVAAPPVACLATMTGGALPSFVTYTSVPGGYQASFQWSLNFACSSGNISDCAMVFGNTFSIYDPDNNTWSTPSQTCGMSDNYDCDSRGNVLPITTLWPMPTAPGVPSGTTYKISFLAVPFDPSAGPNCTNQDLASLGDQEYTVPSPPP